MQNAETLLQTDHNGTVGQKTTYSTFVASVLAMAGGAAIAQGIGIISSPIICRIFSPDDFGHTGIFRSIVMVVWILTCLCYNLSIMLPKQNEDAATLFVFCCILFYGACSAGFSSSCWDFTPYLPKTTGQYFLSNVLYIECPALCSQHIYSRFFDSHCFVLITLY